MKEWLTAREIAEHALPDLPTTKRGVNLYAEANGWVNYPALCRLRSGVGGGYEYHRKLLPTLAQLAYAKRHLVVGDPALVLAEEAPAVNLTERAAKERDARLAIIAAYDRFAAGMRLNQQACLRLFCDRYEMGSILVESWVKELIPNVSTRSLFRWKSARAKGARDALAVDRSKARKGSGLLETANNGAVRSFVLAWIASSPHLSADIIRGYCEDHFGPEITTRQGELKPLPPERTFQQFIKDLKASEKVVLTKITDPDSFRSNMKLSGTGAYRHITSPNAMWMIDASPVDALCLDGRHSMYACLDLATRRYVITLSKTPRASAVGLMIRKATLKWGVAQVIKTDNGSDFVAVSIKRLFDNLDIEPDVSDAYSPEQKGHVERVIKTFQHEVCPQLPGYVGHNVADRKAIEGRKSFSERLGADEKDLFEVALTSAQLQQHIDDWLEYVYHPREHAGLTKRENGTVIKRSPNDIAAASAETIRRVDERALDALLMPVAGKNGIRVMGKQGLKIDGFFYLAGSIMVATECFVRLDPLDMGKVYVFDAADGRFLDIALCAELSDVDPQEYVKAQKQIAAEIIQAKEREIKAEIREQKKGPSGIERTIRLAKRKAADRDAANANVITLPKREERHTTPALDAALEAVTLPRTPAPRPLSEKAADLHAAIVREAQVKAASNVISLDPDAGLSPNARMFKWALAVEDSIAAGNVIADAEAIRLVNFQASSTYQTMKDIMTDFGLDAALRM